MFLLEGGEEYHMDIKITDIMYNVYVDISYMEIMYRKAAQRKLYCS